MRLQYDSLMKVKMYGETSSKVDESCTGHPAMIQWEEDMERSLAIMKQTLKGNF